MSLLLDLIYAFYHPAQWSCPICSSSIPQELSSILSLEIVSNWDKQSWFPVRYFLSENVLCVDRVSQACL